MNRTRRLITTALASACALGLASTALAKGKHNHQSGPKLLGDKARKDGRHVIDKKGPHTVSVDVKGGKIAAFHVKHATKGELPIKKYKTRKNMVVQAQSGYVTVAYLKVQDQYLGTTYIGYSYYDDYGDEYICWFPYDMILDAETGAVDYVAVT